MIFVAEAEEEVGTTVGGGEVGLIISDGDAEEGGADDGVSMGTGCVAALVRNDVPLPPELPCKSMNEKSLPRREERRG